MTFELNTLPFLALYAETHFRFFRFFPSCLFRRQPEILFDAPQRVEPDKDLPVVLLCNDIDRFPVDRIAVSIVLTQNKKTIPVFDESDTSGFSVNHPCRNHCAVYLFRIPHHCLTPGPFSINGKAVIVQNKKKFVILNDNYTTSSKAALTGIVAQEPRPGFSLCRYGDLHTHSQFSRSHVEFGPPVSIIDTMAATSGLSFVGITDHSYDLACYPENYLRQDPHHNLWKLFQDEIARNRDTYNTTIIPGEEISTCNRRNKVVHLGALGIRTFIPGSKDGARPPLKTAVDEPDIREAASQIEKQGGISFAAHPGARSGIMQRIFLKRGTWDCADVPENLTAFQAVNNGFFSPSWHRARALWIRLLQSGRKLPLIAGNDAHGDFNRYRYLKIPFFAVGELGDRHFSHAVTGIYTKESDEASLLSAIKNGKTFVTTGPYLEISASATPGTSLVSHSGTSGAGAIFVNAISTPEFGAITQLTVFRGCYVSAKESIVHSGAFTEDTFSIAQPVSLPAHDGPGYCRAELLCVNRLGTRANAVTSPCYCS